jgi:acetyl esterase
MPLDPQAKALLDVINAVEGPALHELSPTEARQVYAQLSAGRTSDDPVGSVEDRSVPSPDGEVPIRIYRPQGDGPFGVCLFFHGGGWVIGDIDTHDAQARSLASRSGCAVVSVDYRLAPEHVFPGPLEDCFAATTWVVEHAGELGFDPARVAVAGDSAGGNLAAAVSILARDRGGPDLAFQLLVYPATDHSFSQASYLENAEGYFLTAAAMRWFSAHYLADGEPTDPLAAPLHAPDLSNLPPALVITAEYDPLRDEGEAYGDRLVEAGVPCTIRRYDGMIHGFLGLAHLLDQGATALDEASSALREAIGRG